LIRRDIDNVRKFLIVSALFVTTLSAPRAQPQKPLDIYFIDVEGGQATLFVTPSGESMLIDTGYSGFEDRDLNRVLATVKQAGLTKLDYLLVTHYHNDHVGNAAAIGARIPVGTYIDHGPTVETDAPATALYDTYVKGRERSRHMLAKPGDKVPIRDLDVTIVTANGEHIARPLARPAAPNPLCAGFKPRDPDPTENARSVGSMIAFGRFRMVDLGDLTWNKEQELVCPNNLLGTVDVYLTTHHGLAQSNAGVIVHALKPRVAIMNNGPKKGGSAEAWQTVHDSPGLQDFWQLHYAVDAGRDHNVAEPMIANPDESAAHYIKLSAQRDGSFTVTNARNKLTKTYTKPNVDGRPAAFSDFRRDVPGAVHKITLADLPAPLASRAVSNPPTVVPRPAGAVPKARPGYTVSEYVGGLDNPRLIRLAPNGDLFVAESDPGRVRVVRGRQADGRARTVSTFATGLNQPFGIAFYPLGPNPTWVYVGNTDSIIRFPYTAGDLEARGAPETIVKGVPAGGNLPGGGHWSRDIAFSPDGKKMYIGVGSFSNVDDPDEKPAEKERAVILEFNPDGTGRRIYATGVRNAVGLAFHPQTGKLWVSVNERDDIGDNLVPDYITHIEEGGFYGWPWFYMGGTEDPRHAGKHPELKATVITPDVLVQPHSASLQLVFHDGSAFAAEHGSWNRNLRTGYKVIRVPFKADGTAVGSYEDFLTGFVTDEGYAWGRPVGVAFDRDGSLLVSDDGSNTIWRVAKMSAGRGSRTEGR
jgi:glucose/arabinose dehydrogenase/beta-lactamase superfamily II metal-dependent hydrolase